MAAVGFASIPISISARGVMADLEKQIGQPMHKVAQKAATDMERAIVDGAKRTANEVEKARKAEVRAAAEVEKAEQKIMAAKEKTRQQTAKVETAEKQLELVRSQQSRKVEDMEASLEKARKDGKLTAEELKRSEELLREARLKADIAVEAKEQAVQRAYGQSARAAQAVEDAEKDRQKALSKAKDAADNVIAAQKRMDDAQGDTNREVREGTSAFEKLREQLRLTGSDLDEAAGKSAGFGDKLLGGLKTMGTGALLGVGAKIGTTITSGIGTAFSKGFSRLESLEAAEASLRGLGRSAEDIELIMGSVNQAVTGTAYGLDEASKAAATFSTLGVASGEGMDRVMSLLVDTTAQANSSLDEMSPIMSKIVAAGGLTTETFDQLNERATGVGEALSKHLGVPIEEVRDLAKDVDFDTFAAAMEANIGGAALESGATFGNALGNMQAALGRLGQKFLEPAFNMGPSVFGAIGGAVDKLNERLSPLIEEWSARLTPIMEDFAAKLGPALEQAIDDVADRLVALVGWVRENEAWLKPLAAVVGGAAAAFTAWQVAVGAWAAATKVATGIQAAFNAVMLANPIMLVVVALGALAAGLTYFFTQTETGQKAWQTFTSTISESWDYTVEKLKAGWDWVQENLLFTWDEAVAGMSESWTYTMDVITGWWDSTVAAVLGVWEQLKAGVHESFERASQRMSDKWAEITGAVSAAWEATTTFVTDKWNALKSAVFDAYLTTIEVVGAAWDRFTGAVGAAWEVLRDRLVNAYHWIKQSVFDAFETALGSLRTAFDVAVESIGKIWEGLKRLFAEPINFVIKTVYTDGIKPVFDGVAEKVGLDSRLPEIKPIGGYARGGVLPGYTPGRDPYTFIEPKHGMTIGLSGGEAILRPEATRALGKEWVDRVNAAARTGGVSGVQNQLTRSHFADGGVLDLGNFNLGGVNNMAGALSAIQASHARFVGRFFPGLFNLTSAMRFTDTGHHSTGKATDWQGTDGHFQTQMPSPASKALARAIFTNFPNSAELIHWPLDGWKNIKNGQPASYDAGTNAQHANHVHWATHSPLQFDGDDIVLDDVPGAGRFSFNPLSCFTGLWDRIVGALPKFDLDGFGDLAQWPGAALSTMGGWVKDWALGKLREWGEKFMNFFGFGGGGAEQWADQAAEALRRMGYGQEHLGAMLRQIEIESSGDPTAVNTWDSNYLRGTPSGGLLQVIEPTYQDVRRRYPEAFEGLPDDRFHPLTNLTAGVAAVTRDWGGPAGRWPTTAGYAHGGLAGPGQGMLLKTAMEPEYVLNPEMTKAFIDWMNAGAGLGGQGSVVRIDAPSPEPVFNAAQWQDIRGLINAIGDLHPELRRMVDELTPQIESMVVQLGKVADPTSEQGIAARSIAGRVLDMGILPQGEVIQSLLAAESDLLAARAAHAERLQGITDKEKELAEAQKDLEELLSSNGEMSVANQRKLADAEKALAKAKADAAEASGKKQAAAAEKVADAEEKLRRVREDVAADADKDAAKRDDEIAKATERVTKAEHDLASARQESVKALDMPIHSLLPQLSGGLMSLSTMAGAASPALAGVAAQLAGAASMAGPAGISVGVALTAIESALSVARKIWDVLDKLVSWVNRIRVEHARLVSESMSNILEWTRLVDQQRQVVGELQQQLINDQIALMGATWRVRQAQFDQARAQLDGVRNVAAAQAALDAEREAAAKRAMWDAKHLGTAFDRYRWAQKLGWAELLQDATIVTPEILALQHEVNAAKLTAELTQRQAVLATLQATWEQHRASVALMRTQEKLRIQTEQLARMAGTEYGMTTGEATVAAEIARLAADNAKLQGAKNDLGSRARGAVGRLLDWDGDGKILGMIDMPWTQEQLGLDAAIAANQKQIERLMQMEAAGLSPEQLSDMERIIHEASLQYAAGRDAAGDAIIRGSWLGDAQRAKEITGIEQAVIDWEQSMLDLQNSIQDAQDTLAFETQAQELAEQIAALQAAANSEQYRADAIREDNIAVREALEALADLESSVSRAIVEKRPINITLTGDAVSADRVRELLEQLNAEAEELDIRVTHLEEPGRDEALAVLDSRRRW